MTSRFTATSTRALLAGLLALGAAGAVKAQTTEMPSQQPQQQAPGAQAMDFSDQELQSFVAATVKVREIGAQWEPQIQGATDEQEATELRDQANAEMAAAVEEEGLTTEQYREIYMAALADPELNNRLAEIYEQTQAQ